MKLFYRLALLLASVTLLVSCSADKIDMKPVLTLDQSALNFTKSAGVRSVSVTKNAGNEFFCIINSGRGADWITITPGQDSFDVAVTDNMVAEERSATIQVSLRKGTLIETITVTQSATDDVLINLSKEELVFEKEVGKQSVYLETNSIGAVSMSVEAGVDWITFDPENNKNKLTFSVTENADTKWREAVVTVSTGDAQTTMNVIQKGVMHFDFPFINLGYNYYGAESERGLKYHNSAGDAQIYEKKRESILIHTYLGGATYTFSTNSAIFPEVGYGQYQSGSVVLNSVRSASMKSPIVKPFDLLDDAEFQKHLAREGFEFAYRNEITEVGAYWNKQRQIVMQVKNFDGPGGDIFTFTHSRFKPNDPENQTDAYPTFVQFPTAFMEWGATLDDIKLWEDKAGGVIYENYPTVCTFIPDPINEPEVLERAYYLNTATSPATLTKVLILFNSLDLVFYHTGSVHERDAYAMTSEFEALLASEGYVFDKVLPSGLGTTFKYKNTTAGTILDAYVNRFEVEGLIPRLCIAIYPM